MPIRHRALLSLLLFVLLAPATALLAQTPTGTSPDVRAQMQAQTAELRTILEKSTKLPLERSAHAGGGTQCTEKG